MSKASNLAGFVTSISPPSNLNVGVVTASSFVGNLTGNATATTISAGGTTGTSGQVLQSTGTGVTWTTAATTQLDNVIGYNSAGIRSDSWNPASNGRLAVFGQGNFQVFTSPGTFVVNPGISSIRVRVVGAGGNGGSGGSGGPSPAAVTSGGGAGGGGGGGGGYAHKVITSFTAPRTYTVTVGSAPGGTSSFGSEVSATGGSSGQNGATGTPTWPTPWPGTIASGGAGGTGSGGDVNFTGATGINGGVPNSTPLNYAGIGGTGGAAATQLGNATGASVPGLTGKNAILIEIPAPSPPSIFAFVDASTNTETISRFPFDIFHGGNTYVQPPSAPGAKAFPSTTPTTWKNGVAGGAGYSGAFNWNPTPPVGSTSAVLDGGNGGVGAAGGAGGAVFYVGFVSIPPGSPGGNGGIGGGGGGAGGGIGNAATAAPTPIAKSGGTGGTGGPGIVIVEW